MQCKRIWFKFTLTDTPAYSLDMMAVVGDVEIQDTKVRAVLVHCMVVYRNVLVHRIQGPGIPVHQELSFSKRHRLLLLKLYRQLKGQQRNIILWLLTFNYNLGSVALENGEHVGTTQHCTPFGKRGLIGLGSYFIVTL